MKKTNKNQKMKRIMKCSKNIKMYIYLKFVRNLIDKGSNLLHESIHGALRAGFQQSCDCQSCNWPIWVGDQIFKVQIASRHGCRMSHRHLKLNIKKSLAYNEYNSSKPFLSNQYPMLNSLRLFHFWHGKIGSIIDLLKTARYVVRLFQWPIGTSIPDQRVPQFLKLSG